jgi:hypothetical protein
LKKKLSLWLILLIILVPTVCFAGVNPDNGVRSGKSTMAIIITNYNNLKPYPTVLNSVMKNLKKSLRSNKIDFAVDDAHTAMLEYLEDKQIDDPRKLSKNDLIDFGNKYKYSYVTMLDFNQITIRQSKNGIFFSDSKYYRITSNMVAKTVDVKSKNYSYQREIYQEGSSHSGNTILPIVVLLRHNYSADDVDAFFRGAKLPLTTYLFSDALLPQNEPNIIDGWKDATDKCIKEFITFTNSKYNYK